MVDQARGSWEAIEFEGGGASRLDRLRFDGQSLIIRTDLEDLVICDEELTGVGVGLQIWSNPPLLLLASTDSSAIWIVDAPNGTIERDYLMRTDSTTGFRFLQGRPLDDGSLVLLYESGLLRLDHLGRTVWHRLHEDLSARILSANTTEVVLESRAWHPDSPPRQTRFATNDGADL